MVKKQHEPCSMSTAPAQLRQIIAVHSNVQAQLQACEVEHSGADSERKAARKNDKYWSGSAQCARTQNSHSALMKCAWNARCAPVPCTAPVPSCAWCRVARKFAGARIWACTHSRMYTCPSACIVDCTRVPVHACVLHGTTAVYSSLDICSTHLRSLQAYRGAQTHCTRAICTQTRTVCSVLAHGFRMEQRERR